MNTIENRINELDLFRGICIIGVFFSHLCYDLALFVAIPDYPEIISYLFQYGGIFFIVLSGICSTLGSNSFRRGCVVLLSALIITAATYLFSIVSHDTEDVVRFGILHLLGTCMLLTPLFRNISFRTLPIISVLFIAIGFIFQNTYVEPPYLFPFGLITAEFSSGDYWPIFPNVGFYCIGIWIGMRFYPEKKPLMPSLQGKLPVLSWIGRNSLILYLIQQPIIYGVLSALNVIGLI